MQNGFSFKQRAVKVSDLLQTLLCRTAREWENGREIKIKLQVGERKCMEQSDRQAHVPTRSTRVLHLWTFPLTVHSLTFSVSPISEISADKNKRWGKFQVTRKYASAATSHTKAFNWEVQIYGKIQIYVDTETEVRLLLVGCRTAVKLLSCFFSHSADISIQISSLDFMTKMIEAELIWALLYLAMKCLLLFI